MHPIIITMLAFLIASPASAAEYDEGYSAGTSSAQSILSEIGGADRINRRIQVPMTSDTGSLTTFQSTYADPDEPGPQDFKAQLTETSSDAFLEVLIQPGPAGDIGTLTVRQDTDFDNAMDASYTSPVIASGVCANGIISCYPGTWYNCRFYRWQANPDSSVYLSEVDGIADLAVRARWIGLLSQDLLGDGQRSTLGIVILLGVLRAGKIDLRTALIDAGVGCALAVVPDRCRIGGYLCNHNVRIAFLDRSDNAAAEVFEHIGRIAPNQVAAAAGVDTITAGQIGDAIDFTQIDE
jgi:hypothetical protein